MPDPDRELRRVLVIDDDLDFIEVKVLLDDPSLEIIARTNAEAGLQEALRIPPDIILLDAMMPGGHGLRMLDRFQEVDALSRVPVFVTTNLAWEDVQDWVVRAGVEYVPKIWPPEKFRSRVREALQI
ncbi:two-component system response regulator [Elusimicrobiota bacterium]